MSTGGGLLLEGVGRLINQSITLAFEIARDSKAEVSDLYKGVTFTHMISKSGSWCAGGVLPDEQFIIQG